MSSVEHLLASLRSQGVVDGPGRFTLDPQKAREKLRQFQLPDPRRYVLFLVQAAVLKGATRIAFNIDADDMRMEWNGAPFQQAELENVYGALLGGGGDETLAWRHLALGINAAMALNPKFVHVHSGAHAVTLFPEGSSRLQSAPRVLNGTSLHVRDRFRAGVVVQFLRNLHGSLAEEEYLREACRWASAEITLDGGLISQQPSLAEAVGVTDLSAVGLQGRIGFRPHEASALTVLKHQVSIQTFTPAELLPGTVALVEAPQLQTDLSQTELVQDSSYRALLDTLRSAEHQAVARLAERMGAGDPSLPVGPARWILLSALLRCPSLAVLQQDPTYRALSELPLWVDARGEERPVCLKQVVERWEHTGRARFSSERQPMLAAQPHHPVPYFSSKREEQLFVRLFNRGAVNAFRQLREEVEGRHNRDRLQRRRLKPELPKRSYLARATLRAQPNHPIRGEVGLREPTSRWSRLYLIVEGHLLTETRYPLPMSGLEVFVEGPFAANKTFNGVRPDPVLARTLLSVGDCLVPLAEQLAARAVAAGDPPSEWLREAVVAAWAHAMDPQGPQRLLQAAGLRNPELLAVTGGLRQSPWLLNGRRASWRLPMFVNLAGEHVAPAQLPEQLCVVAAELPLPESLPDDLQPRVTFRASAAGRRLLCALRGERNVRDVTEHLLRQTDRVRHRHGPVETVELEGPALITVSSADPPTQVGILTEDLEPAVRPHGLRGRILVDMRHAHTCELPHPLGPMRAVVAWPEGLTIPPGDQLPAALREHLERRAEALLTELTRRYATLAPPKLQLARRYLLGALVACCASEQAVRWGQLRYLALFPTLGYRNQSLAALQERARAGLPLRYVTESSAMSAHHPRDGEEREVLRLRPDELHTLTQIFGPEVLVDATHWLRRPTSAAAATPEPQAKAAPPALLRETTLVRRRVEQGAIEAEVGLPLVHAAQPPESEHRQIRLRWMTSSGGEGWSHIEPSHGCGFTALVRYRGGSPMPTGALPPTDPRVLELVEALLPHVLCLFNDLHERWPQLSEGERRAAWQHALDLWTAPEALPPDLEQRWEKVPAICSADGRRVSLHDVRAFVAAHHHLPLAEPTDRGALPPGVDLALLPTALELKRLPDILGAPWESYQQALASHRQARRRLHLRPELREPPGRAPARMTVSGGDLKATLWLPLPEEPSGVDLGYEGRTLETVQGSPWLPCAGTVTGPGVQPTHTLDGVRWRSAQESWLRRQVLELYQRAITERRNDLDGLGDETFRRALLRAWEAMDRQLKDNQHLPRGELELYQSLSRLPIMRRQGVPVTPLQQRRGQANLRPQAHGDPEQALVEALQEALEVARQHHAGPLVVNLDHLSLVEGSQRVATAGPGRIRLHRDHPVVLRALADPRDAGHMLLLASAVYSAFNHHWSGITNEDEVWFITALAHGATGGPGPAP